MSKRNWERTTTKGASSCRDRPPRSSSAQGSQSTKSVHFYSLHVHDARRLQGASLPGGEEDQAGEVNRGDSLGEKVGAHLPSRQHPSRPSTIFLFSGAPLPYTKHPKFGDGKKKKTTGPSLQGDASCQKQVFNTALLRFLRSRLAGLALPRTLSVRMVVSAKTPKAKLRMWKIKTI